MTELVFSFPDDSTERVKVTARLRKQYARVKVKHALVKGQDRVNMSNLTFGVIKGSKKMVLRNNGDVVMMHGWVASKPLTPYKLSKLEA